MCPKWFGSSKLEQSDGATCLGRANGKPLLDYGQTKRYDFHVVDVTKPILSVSCLCENGVEARLAKESFLRFGDGHEPLIRKSGVRTMDSEKTREINLMGDHKIDARVLMDSQKTDAHKLMENKNETRAVSLRPNKIPTNKDCDKNCAPIQHTPGSKQGKITNPSPHLSEETTGGNRKTRKRYQIL